MELAEKKLSDSKAWLLFSQPFFGGLLMTFRFIEKNDMLYKTMAVDNKNIYWDREFIEKTPMEELRGVLLHEVMHVALSHISRLKPYYKIEKWNIAADYAVNYYVIKTGEKLNTQSINSKVTIALPKGGCYDPKYADMSMEEIYKKLPQDVEAKLPPNAFRDIHMPGEQGDEQDVMKRMVTVWESLSNDQKEKAIGTMPQDIRDSLAQFKEPKVDWRRYIAESIIDLFGSKDYSFNPRSNSYACIDEDGFYPRLIGMQNKTLVVVADTSGSVSQEWLEEFAGEMGGAVELADRTILMTNDADVHEVEDANQFSDILTMIKMRGGGGTDFRPPFEWLKKQEIIPDALIFLTDGWGPFPSYDPGYRVIFGVIPNTSEVKDFPKWSNSEVVILER